MIRIARLDDEKHQIELIESLIGGANRTQIRDRIDEIKGKVKPTVNRTPTDADAKPKPKLVYRTKYDAIVIVQSLTEKLVARACHKEFCKRALMRAPPDFCPSGAEWTRVNAVEDLVPRLWCRRIFKNHHTKRLCTKLALLGFGQVGESELCAVR